MADRLIDVRSTCDRVTRAARFVRIDEQAVRRWAHRRHDHRSPSEAASLAGFAGSRDEIANLILLVDALNFCFWSAQPISIRRDAARLERYTAFAALLASAAESDRRWLDAGFWTEMTRTHFENILRCEGELLLIDERVAVLRETGETLSTRYDGRFANAVEAGGNQASGLVSLLCEEFPSFRDAATYDGEPVWFLKRAQICSADLGLAWSRRDYGTLTGLERLTAFADYRVPQTLRQIGILVIDAGLADRINRAEEIPAGGPEEVELRAATITAVEHMAQALAANGQPADAWRIDFLLWEASHDASIGIEHHRTLTIYY
ncbi:MAG: queuosine salvage family protein [Phycisphaerae bacterium]